MNFIRYLLETTGGREYLQICSKIARKLPDRMDEIGSRSVRRFPFLRHNSKTSRCNPSRSRLAWPSPVWPRLATCPSWPTPRPDRAAAPRRLGPRRTREPTLHSYSSVVLEHLFSYMYSSYIYAAEITRARHQHCRLTADVR